MPAAYRRPGSGHRKIKLGSASANVVLTYALFYVGGTKEDLANAVGIDRQTMRRLLRLPNKYQPDETVEVWDHVLRMISQRLGELFAIRRVIKSKMRHTEIARTNRAVSRKIRSRL